MHNIKLASIVLVTSLFLLTACGQKGALYITAEPAEQTETSAPDMTEKATEEEAKKKAAE